MAAKKPICEYLATARIDKKGQLSLPKRFREAIRSATGARFAVLRMGSVLLLIPEQERLERLRVEIGGAFLAAGSSAESLLKTLPEVRKHLYEEHYGSRILSPLKNLII